MAHSSPFQTAVLVLKHYDISLVWVGTNYCVVLIQTRSQETSRGSYVRSIKINVSG